MRSSCAIRPRRSAVLEPAARRHAGESLAETLAAIHAVDPDAVGLSDLGRKEGYIERQLKRWYSQWTQSKTRELPADPRRLPPPERAHSRAGRGHHRPRRLPPRQLHGLDAAGDVVAVLDWEICTLGDPMADVGLLKVYWSGPHDVVAGLAAPATAVEGFLDRDDVLAHYASASGRELVTRRLLCRVCLLEARLHRRGCLLTPCHLHGAMGADKDPSAFDHFRSQVERSAENAAALCAGIE